MPLDVPSAKRVGPAAGAIGLKRLSSRFVRAKRNVRTVARGFTGPVWALSFGIALSGPVPAADGAPDIYIRRNTQHTSAIKILLKGRIGCAALVCLKNPNAVFPPDPDWNQLYIVVEHEYFSGVRHAKFWIGESAEYSKDGSCSVITKPDRRAEIDDGKNLFFVNMVTGEQRKTDSRAVTSARIRKEMDTILSRSPGAAAEWAGAMGLPTSREEAQKLVQDGGTKVIAGVKCDYQLLGENRSCLWSELPSYPGDTLRPVMLRSEIVLGTSRHINEATFFQKGVRIQDEVFRPGFTPPAEKGRAPRDAERITASSGVTSCAALGLGGVRIPGAGAMEPTSPPASSGARCAPSAERAAARLEWQRDSQSGKGEPPLTQGDWHTMKKCLGSIFQSAPTPAAVHGTERLLYLRTPSSAQQAVYTVDSAKPAEVANVARAAPSADQARAAVELYRGTAGLANCFPEFHKAVDNFRDFMIAARSPDGLSGWSRSQYLERAARNEGDDCSP